MGSIRGFTGIAIAMVGAALLASTASGTTTFCSKPQRAGIKRAATLAVPWSKVPALKSWLDQHSKQSVGMSFSSLESGQPGRPVDKEILILESPKVSVVIYIVAKSGSSTARATLERTCINDEFEPWQPYWYRFVASMKAAGFVLVSNTLGKQAVA